MASTVCCEIVGAGTKESSEPPAVWANLASSIAVPKHHATTQKGRACRWLPNPIHPDPKSQAMKSRFCGKLCISDQEVPGQAGGGSFPKINDL